MRKYSFVLGTFLLSLSLQSISQSVAINNDASLPTLGSMLDVKSSSKGLLIPRIALTGPDDILTVPVRPEGLLVYNTASSAGGGVAPGFYYWDGASWVRLTNNTSALLGGWLLGGNNGATPATHFLGTRDNNALVFKVNSQKAGYVGVETNDGNVFWGYLSGNSNTGYSNVGIGIRSLYNNTASSNVVAVGDSTLYNNTGIGNVAIGSKALFSNTSGEANSANGYQALYSNTSGFHNTGTGYGALYSNTTGFGNSAHGGNSLLSNTIGMQNTANGESALTSNTTGSRNTGEGVGALGSNVSGSDNSALGAFALWLNTTGYGSVAIGVNALYNNNQPNMVAVGDYALFSNTTGSENTALGSKSLFNNLNGYDNAANGFHSLYSNTSGALNSAQGSYALLSNTSGSQNTANGALSLVNNTTGNNNVATGFHSLYENTVGIENTANGFSALLNNTTGINNVADGSRTLHQNSTGSQNTAVGWDALFSNTSGNSNTGLGNSTEVGAPNLTNATAIGAQARVDCSNCLVLGSISGENGASSNVNVGIGSTNPGFPLNFASSVGDKISLFGNTGDHYGLGIQSALLQIYSNAINSDVAVGYGSSAAFVENFRVKGNGNVSLGMSTATATLTFGQSLSKKIILFHGVSGGDAGFGVFTNELRIHSDYSGAAVTFGYDNAGTSFVENMRIQGNGSLLVRGSVTANSSFYTSDARFKKNISLIDNSTDKILLLNAYHFHWKDEQLDSSLQTGFLAQEVEKIFPELVRADSKGYLSVNYVGLIPYLIQSAKEQQKEIKEQQKEILSDHEKIDKLTNDVEDLKKLVSRLANGR